MSSLRSLVNASRADMLSFDSWTSSGASLHALYLITAALSLLFMYSQRESYPKLPRLNPKKFTELTWSARLFDYAIRSRELFAEGTRKFPDRPYKLFTDLGDVIVVPNKYAEELKSSRDLDFNGSARDAFHDYIPGLTPLHTDMRMRYVIQNYMTKTLPSLTEQISQEAIKALREIFPNSKDWTEVTPDKVMHVMSRMSSRIFMGDELCNDMEWIKASSEYIHLAGHGVFELSRWPRALRSWVHWFLPTFTEIRRRLAHCRAVLQPHIDRRVAVKKAAAERGEPNPYNDSIEWFSRELTPGADPTEVQINLTILAVHTTTDLLVQTLVDIAKNPEILGPLREETIHVLKTDGFKKSGLQKLRLMDACFKESQRLRPIFLAYFRRQALVDITLEDGFVIKKGTLVAMDGRRVLHNEDYYPDPLRWDPYRYFQMREAGEEHKSHFVTSSDKHIGFGHGIHACPGRFFAAHELKIIFSHILLMYDWTIPEDVKSLPNMTAGSHYMMPPGTRFLFTRRQEELDFSALEY
ncbi:cytochrome P450 [Colletotrichum graminicola]|uniref:Cytochrome P450 n=1 Tax=Colletotrichum graminicola (strain M1.001 / M2 / FGSC 10212) TaxID=645133 RepID=E3R002_COLGM|nr:cytochrome P450 [Colletotrichum graminicola M1.001]EFQ36440.1 cytochrome P450 [Colletotrichum graminicola M1.001]WDK08779.1 cytochrome P450 [Colletotrichum graminicola]